MLPKGALCFSIVISLHNTRLALQFEKLFFKTAKKKENNPNSGWQILHTPSEKKKPKTNQNPKNHQSTLIHKQARFSLQTLHKCTCLSPVNKQAMKSNHYLIAQTVYVASTLYRCIWGISFCSGLNTFCRYLKFCYFHIKGTSPKNYYLLQMFLFLPFQL